MNMVKTIAELNSKVWYRLVKVLFVLCFVIVLAAFNLIEFSSGVRQVDPNQTTIQCNLGAKRSFTAKSIGLYLNTGDFPNGEFDYKAYFEGYNDYSIENILNKCYPTQTTTRDIYDRQEAADLLDKHGWTALSIHPDGVPNSLSQTQKDTLAADFNSTYGQETKGLTGNAKARYLAFSSHLFDITPAFAYDAFLRLFFIGNIVILLVFEVVRRGFYYIALGSFKPKIKQEIPK